ncbi:MAG: hypothetical protein U0794_20425 [Isosphaeraceae bacterium]
MQPLNVVKTSVYYLRHAIGQPTEKREEHLQRIGCHVELADGVITTLSNFAKMPAPQGAGDGRRAAACASARGQPGRPADPG